MIAHQVEQTCQIAMMRNQESCVKVMEDVAQEKTSTIAMTRLRLILHQEMCIRKVMVPPGLRQPALPQPGLQQHLRHGREPVLQDQQVLLCPRHLSHLLRHSLGKPWGFGSFPGNVVQMLRAIVYMPLRKMEIRRSVTCLFRRIRLYEWLCLKSQWLFDMKWVHFMEFGEIQDSLAKESPAWFQVVEFIGLTIHTQLRVLVSRVVLLRKLIVLQCLHFASTEISTLLLRRKFTKKIHVLIDIRIYGIIWYM